MFFVLKCERRKTVEIPLRYFLTLQILMKQLKYSADNSMEQQVFHKLTLMVNPI
jgi:hypothetical protein